MIIRNSKKLFKLTLLFSTWLIIGLSGLASAASWSNPTSLAAITLFGLPTNNASVAVAPNGDSVAVWTNEATNVVQYAQRKNGVWTTAKAVYTPSATKGETTSSAYVVLKSDGTAVTIFASSTPGVRGYCSVGGRIVPCLSPSKSFAKIATLQPGATTWTKTNLSAQGIIVDDTQVAIDSRDNILASWRYIASAGQATQFQTATQSASVWSSPQTIYSSMNGLTWPNLSMGTSGHALLTWQEKLPAGSNAAFAIKTLYRDNVGTWSQQVEEVANLAAQTWTLRSGIDGNGQATLVWDNNYSIQMSRRATNTVPVWSPAETLTSATGTQYGYSGPFSAYVPDLAVNAAGDVLVAWLESDVNNNLWTIESKLFTSSSPVQASWPVDTLTGFAYPKVTLSPDGSVGAVAWNDNGAGAATIASLTSVSGGSWAQPLAIGMALWDSQVAVGSGQGSNISAVWIANTATEFKYKYQASSYRQ